MHPGEEFPAALFCWLAESAVETVSSFCTKTSPGGSGQVGPLKKGPIVACVSHQMSIMVIPGLIQLLTYARTCRCASAACLKSFHISSLAPSSARFSSLVVRHAALRLAGEGVHRRSAEKKYALF